MAFLSKLFNNLGITGPGERGTSLLSAILGPTGPAARRDTRSITGQYANIPWVQSVCRRVSGSVAAVPWRLYVRTAGGKSVSPGVVGKLAAGRRADAIRKGMTDGTFREIEEHPFLSFIENGNAAISGNQVRSLTAAYLDLVGEAYWMVERGTLGVPIAPWPVPPHWITALPTPDQPYYKLDLGTWSGDIPITEIIPFKHPDPLNPYGRGIGLVTSLADEIEADEYSAKHIGAWFKNRARPDLLLIGKNLSPTDTKRFEREWVSEHRGFWNQFKPRFLGGTDITVHELNQSFQNMELVELRRLMRDVVMQVWGVPPEVLGVVENSNRATIEASDFIFQSLTIVPRLEMFRDTFRTVVIPMFDAKLLPEYDNPVPEDRAARLTAMQASAHAYTIDEWRSLAQAEALPDNQGAFFMMPFNLIPVRKPEDIAEAMIPPEPTPAPAPEEEPKPEMEEEPETEPEMEEETGEGTPEEEEEPEEGEEEGKAISPFKRRRRPCGKAADDLIDELIEAGTELNSPVLTVTDVEIISQAADPKVLQAKVRPVLADTVAAFGDYAIREAGLAISFDLLDPRVTRFLELESSTRIKGLVNETTRQSLRDTISAGISAGESMSDIQDRIATVFDDARGTRSHVIARTETHRAANFGSYEGLRDAGVNQTQWLITQGANHRWTHSEGSLLDGQIRPLNDPFVNDLGMSALYPGGFGDPGEDIQCLCRVVAYFGKDYTSVQKKAMWKAFVARTQPYVLEYRRAIRAGFSEQQKAVTALLAEIWEKKA